MVALEVDGRPPVAREYHPVELFDGVHVPYPDESFDAVFSSNVLEHVVELDRLVTDTGRVLEPGGTAVHAMPTPSWRAWSSLTYLLRLPARAAAQFRRRLPGARDAGEVRAESEQSARAGSRRAGP